MPDPVRDPLDELRERLEATREAAERIVRDVPPQGWASDHRRDETAQEVQALVALLQALRELVPPELWEQVREVVRQLLLLLRALLDHLVARLAPGEGPAAREAPRPQDIPIT